MRRFLNKPRGTSEMLDNQMSNREKSYKPMCEMPKQLLVNMRDACWEIPTCAAKGSWTCEMQECELARQRKTKQLTNII